jgi:hypothetical protein
MVYLAPGRGYGSQHGGGWHATLAGRALYSGGWEQLKALVDSALRRVAATWPLKMDARNTRLEARSDRVEIRSSLVTRLAREMEVAGVGQVRRDGHYIQLHGRSPGRDAASAYSQLLLGSAGLSVYVVDGSTGDWHSIGREEDASGAGVVLLEMYRSGYVKPPRTEPAIIMFREGNSYVESGGGCEHGDGALATAQRELFEESMGTFAIDTTMCVKNGRVILHRYGYVAFVVPVAGPRGSGILRDTYESNLRAVVQAGSSHTHAVPRPWQETSGMTRFFVSDLLSAGLLQGGGGRALRGVLDVYGRECSIAPRARAVLKKAHLNGLLSVHPAAVNRLEITRGPLAGVPRAIAGHIRTYATRHHGARK